jgi:hypothetical protein
MVKKGMLRYASFDMKRLRDAIRPVSFCTSFLFCGSLIGVIVLILSGFASMPFIDTKHPKTFPLVILHTQFSGFYLSLASRMLVMVSAKSKI